MNPKPFSLIDDDDYSSQTHFSSKMKKSNKDEEDNYFIINKNSIISVNKIKNETAQKENNLKNLDVNNQQNAVNNLREKINKGNLFNINIKNKILSLNNNKSEIDSTPKDTKDPQDLSYIVKKEENKDNKLSKNLLNDKKEKKNSYHGKIYFYIAISMLLYQYLSYVFLIELPIIQSKSIFIYMIIYRK